MIAKQVRLGQLQAGIVQGLKNAVHIVALFGSYFDQTKALPYDVLNACDIVRVIWLIKAEQIRSEEPVRCPDTVGDVGSRQLEDASTKGLTVHLGRQQAKALVAFTELVNQIFNIYTGRSLRIRISNVITDSGECDHQRGQSLLAIDDEPLLESSGRVGKRTGCQDYGSHEVARTSHAILDPLSLRKDVLP
ncbi:MAG TPA: hypothetical protein VIQ76_04930 [Propionibacteriaceae bacterium]